MNMDTTRKAFSAVMESPVSPNTRNVTSWIRRDAVKKKLPDGVPFPAALKKAADAAAEETPAEGGEA